MTERSADDDIRDHGFAVTVVENSWLGRVVSSASSKGSGVVESVTDVVKGSYLYRWLTAEPEPDVVVIDLRETYTVGPVIRLLDATIESLQPYWEESTLKRLTDACIRAIERAGETKVGRALASVLAPPEPPERAGAQSEGEDDEVGAGDDAYEERDSP